MLESRFARIVDKIYEAAFIPEKWQRVVDPIGVTADCAGSTMFLAARGALALERQYASGNGAGPEIIARHGQVASRCRLREDGNTSAVRPGRSAVVAPDPFTMILASFLPVHNRAK